MSSASEIESPQQLVQELAKADYLADPGLATALPHVDTFVSGHSMNALNEVMAAIAGASERRVDAC
ncbi:hypothetical protein OAD85_08475 [Actinomycetota bacterium]|nr:hypothetical protein [Actinomycetota bacterium]